MIVHNRCNNVELTKVHYYDNRENAKNLEIYTISRNYKTKPNHTIIKKNIFGHKWVLKINENRDEELKSGKSVRLFVYVLVSVCILIALCFGIYFSFDQKYFANNGTSNTTKLEQEHENETDGNRQINLSFSTYNKTFYSGKETDNNRKNESNTETMLDEVSKNSTMENIIICRICSSNEVCLNIIEGDKPQCKQIVDRKDPTGCGGLCKVNLEYCKVLDVTERLYQCRKLKHTLNCTNNAFNCGNMCISFKFRCDGIFHCSDKTDEIGCECNLEERFQCGNSTGCLERWKKCDGKVDCWDHSDETNCSSGKCNGKEVACRSGDCIRYDQFCDGIYQCPDKSDEPFGCEVQNATQQNLIN